MYRISLINMPFASLEMPSLALTQLQSVTEQRFGDRVRVRTLYLNHEFAHFLGLELYQEMTHALAANNSGIGEWFFRQLAFPELPDNSPSYFLRYFPQRDPETEDRKRMLAARRSQLERFLQSLIARHRLAEEDLVGFTSMFSQNCASIALARLIKEENPDAVTVLGGANCEAPMGRELAVHVGAIDFVASGPALVGFPRLVGHQMNGETDKSHQIRGICSRRNADSELLQGPGAIGEELPIEVPVALDYEPFLASLEKSFPDGAVRPTLTFETSRGCWWGERSHCTFCGLNGGNMGYRSMPPDQAVELFEELFAYSDRCSRFQSVDNILPRQYLEEVLPKLEPPPGISIFYEVKADLKEHEMEILARARVNQVQPGIESLATSTLRLMRKGITAFQNVVFLKHCVKYAIDPAWNLLIGFPREDPSVYQKYVEDIPLLVHLPPPSGAHPVRFDRYSPYFVQADVYGLDLSPYDFYRYVYPFREETLENLAYYFEDCNYDADYIVGMVAWSDKLSDRVRRWRELWDPRQDGRRRAELSFRHQGGARVVYDSRSGEPEVHEVGDLGLKVLDCIALKGRKVADMARHADVDPAVAAREVADLKDRGLVFQENDRYVSLVLDGGCGAGQEEGRRECP